MCNNCNNGWPGLLNLFSGRRNNCCGCNRCSNNGCGCSCNGNNGNNNGGIDPYYAAQYALNNNSCGCNSCNSCGCNSGNSICTLGNFDTTNGNTLSILAVSSSSCNSCNSCSCNSCSSCGCNSCSSCNSWNF